MWLRQIIEDVMVDVVGLREFFDQISKLIEDSKRQYGLANRSYAEYIAERIEYAISVCSNLLDGIQGVDGLEEYSRSTHQLIDCLKVIFQKWEQYSELLESHPATQGNVSYRAMPQLTESQRPGRPRFDIPREQLEYLSSLSFKWNEIAALLGVSRMTIYR